MPEFSVYLPDISDQKVVMGEDGTAMIAWTTRGNTGSALAAIVQADGSLVDLTSLDLSSDINTINYFPGASPLLEGSHVNYVANINGSFEVVFTQNLWYPDVIDGFYNTMIWSRTYTAASGWSVATRISGDPAILPDDHDVTYQGAVDDKQNIVMLLRQQEIGGVDPEYVSALMDSNQQWSIVPTNLNSGVILVGYLDRAITMNNVGNVIVFGFDTNQVSPDRNIIVEYIPSLGWQTPFSIFDNIDVPAGNTIKLVAINNQFYYFWQESTNVRNALFTGVSWLHEEDLVGGPISFDTNTIKIDANTSGDTIFIWEETDQKTNTENLYLKRVSVQ